MENVNCLLCNFGDMVTGNCTAVGRVCTAVPAVHCPLLRKYLDTGLTPEECRDVKAIIKFAFAGGTSGVGQIRELLRADREGRVVVLPCKVGDKLYEVTGRKTISVYRVKAIRVELFCIFAEWDIEEGFVWKSLEGVSAEEIGKTVFLTRKEAEEALRRAENG